MSAYLHGFGRYLPERVVANAELAERMDRTPEWIENACGIRERRYAAPDEGVVEMAVRAAQDCLARTGAADIGLVVVASGSGASGFPGPAAAVAHALGLQGTPALDVPVASAGSVFGLALAMHLAEAYGTVLLVASEKMSALLGDDPNTAILFGDGAGAALISSRAGRWRLLDSALHSDGQYRDDIKFSGSLSMNGLNVILHASRKMPAVITEVLERNRVAAAQVSAFLVHQANSNLLTRVAKTLGVEQHKFFSNIARYGNTSSASMLIAASEWAETDPVSGHMVFCGFGAGFHWGAVLAASPAA